MTVKTESAAREETATRRPDHDSARARTVERLTRADTVTQQRERTARRSPDGDSARAGIVEQLTRPAPVAQRREDARAPLRGVRRARQAKPRTRRMVVYGIAACAVVRLPLDRRFQANVIMVAILLPLAKRFLKVAAKDVVVGVERYYLGIEPRFPHLRRRRRQRHAA